jgi:uncharacterized protein (DUF1501 family)
MDGTMKMTRRDVLKLGLALTAGPLVPGGIISQVFAAPGAADAKFLLVFLRGGYDAASAIVPVTSDFYYESRPTIAVPKPDPSNPHAAVPLARSDEAVNWGLHPALKSTMLPLWQRGELAFVPFAGTDDLSRSHFETQDSIEVGLPLGRSGTTSGAYGSGFLNRLTVVLDGVATPVAFTDGLPIVMTGDAMVPNVSLKGTGRAPFDDRQTRLLLSMYEGTRFEPLIAEGLDLRRTVAERAEMLKSGEMQAANRNAISVTGFELEARRMAALMTDKFNLAFIDVGGWDTHVNQGNAQGQLANLLVSLGQGLSAFADQMGAAWRKTIVVVISEFGRTFRENGTRGTDHGHGSIYWVLGGAIQGGRLVGEQTTISPQTLNENRDFPVLTEYRALLGGIFRRMYSLDAERLARVFPGAMPRDLDLL